MIKINNNCLSSAWTLTETMPDACVTPADLHAQKLNSIPAVVPGTVAQAYRDANVWSFNKPFDFDAKDWWYQTKFKFSADTTSSLLNFMSLATLCDVWLNGELILSSQNMFVSHQIDVADYLKEDNEIFLCFRSLTNNLSARRPRPRWKTKLVEQQQLRWIRTTLLGRIPGWTPPVAPVGPWQAIFFNENSSPADISLIPTIKNKDGYIEFSCNIYTPDECNIEASLSIDNANEKLTVTKIKSGYSITGKLKVNNIEHWWPHTHGQAKLYSPKLSLTINDITTNYSLTTIGFKNIQLEQENNNFTFIVNDQPVFSRGACWTINDIVSLSGDKEALEQTLTLMRDAGANMIRIGGTMIYEQDHFYQLCDQLGIMVWQDFMFANMDYPIDDADFSTSVDTEIRQTISRLRQHVCLSIYCGNSEIEQQTSMLGLPENEWQSSLFTNVIPTLCNELQPDIPYITSTPTGDILPFHTNKNVTHYYGVGAYQRPVSELRQHDVKFTSECLGFSNIPVTKTRNQILNGQLPVTHHPKWKERTPRDTGTGWDFEDVRDHYTKTLFGIDTTKTRCFDTEQYLALSEITTGEMMSQVFSEWRSTHSQCSGGLVWFLKDLWPGAGWGIIDSNGLPKACYYYLKRCWQPINILLTNETLNGMDIHIANESSQDFIGKLEILILNKESTAIANETIDMNTPKRTTTFNLDKLLKSFYDVTYNYRFGPAKHTVVAVQLKTDNGELLSDAFYFPNAEVPYSDPNSQLTATAKLMDESSYELELSCNRFLYAVNIEVDGYSASNNFFHLLPNTTRQITMKKINPEIKRFKGYVGALNLTEEVKIKVCTE